jgi:hypothetical protein
VKPEAHLTPPVPGLLVLVPYVSHKSLRTPLQRMAPMPMLMFVLTVVLATILISSIAPSLQNMASPADHTPTRRVVDEYEAGGQLVFSDAEGGVDAAAGSVPDGDPEASDAAGRALGARRRRRRAAAAVEERAAAAQPAVQQSNVTTVTDPRCHAQPHTGYAGDGAVVWGLGKPGFHLPDAATCCRACMAHGEICSKAGSRGKQWWPFPDARGNVRTDMRCGGDPTVACTIWTFCPVERCFAFDVHDLVEPSTPRCLVHR